MDHHEPQQLPTIVRVLWAITLGWMLVLLWVGAALIFAVTIIGIPVAVWMYNRRKTVLTLEKR